LLRREGIHDADGEAWLHTYPRVLGYTFKPVSFWYCHRAAGDQDGGLRAMRGGSQQHLRRAALLCARRARVMARSNGADKVFHVSPFNPVQGHYRFRFMRSEHGEHGEQARTVARVDFYDNADADADDGVADTAVLQTSVSGTLQPLTPAALRRAVWRHPAMTLGVVLHIHAQALRLWLKKVPFFRKPAPPQTFVSR
jgi:DUF1365 family protein